jgi:hypothetical protein
VRARLAELADPEAARKAADYLMRAVRRADQPMRTGARHRAHTAAITIARNDIERLAERLRNRAPHDPRTIARVRVLLTDGNGPLHNSRRDAEALRDEIRRRPAGRRAACA